MRKSSDVKQLLEASTPLGGGRFRHGGSAFDCPDGAQLLMGGVVFDCLDGVKCYLGEGGGRKSVSPGTIRKLARPLGMASDEQAGELRHI